MAKRLIINADDLGYDPAVTRGILESMRAGVVSSATFMVNTPHSESAAAASQGLALGLHLNLARHPPVSTAFPPESLAADGGLDEARASTLPASAVAQETAAQLDRFQALLGKPATHLDVHKHLHRHPNILEGICTVASGRNLPVRAIDSAMRAGLLDRGVRTTPHFIGDAGTEAYWTLPRLREQLAALPDGLTELMCHPGYAPQTLRSGYSIQREVELQTFTAPQARAWLAELNIQVIDFGQLDG